MSQKSRDFLNILILLIIVTSLHYLTVSREGSIHDFYRRLYYIPIIIAAFKFRQLGGIMTSVIVSFLYSPHIIFYWSFEDVGLANQVLEIVLFLFIGSITGYLVEQLYQNNLLLTKQLERITDMESLNENILDSMRNVLIALDMNHEVRIINQVGQNLFSAVKPGMKLNLETSVDFKKMENSIMLVMEEKRSEVLETIEIKSENESYTYKSWIYPLRNHQSVIQGTVIILEDISEISKLEKEVHRAEKLSAIGIMASGIAHEIRNPLGIVKTITQTIKSNKNLSDSDNEGLGIVIDEIDRANHVIKELLNFSKPEKGIKTECDLMELINEIIRISGKYALQKNVEITNFIEVKLISNIVKEKVKQALLNLILNAVDAMPNGGNIKIHGHLDNSFIRLEISDDGVGISEEDIDKIFNPFFTTRDSGTGLGLAVTHKIIEEHHGRIYVNSKLNQGTTFIIELPTNSGGEYYET